MFNEKKKKSKNILQKQNNLVTYIFAIKNHWYICKWFYEQRKSLLVNTTYL